MVITKQIEKHHQIITSIWHADLKALNPSPKAEACIHTHSWRNGLESSLSRGLLCPLAEKSCTELSEFCSFRGRHIQITGAIGRLLGSPTWWSCKRTLRKKRFIQAYIGHPCPYGIHRESFTIALSYVAPQRKGHISIGCSRGEGTSTILKIEINESWEFYQQTKQMLHQFHCIIERELQGILKSQKRLVHHKHLPCCPQLSIVDWLMKS